MNAPEKFALPDVQAQEDVRNLRIDQVGIKGVRYPVAIRSAATEWHTSAMFSMSVGLSASAKGTHMSRFIEMLEARSEALDHAGFMRLASDMLTRLDAKSGTIEMRFPYFVQKSAPISGVKSLLDIDVCWRASIDQDGRKISQLQVLVPATSLCPCSRDISDYGAHNQRSHISIEVMLTGELSVEELVGIAERSASCEVYGLLKRADEKYVTERAYENPKFVEDIVRDVVLSLRQHTALSEFTVEVENFESIHNHSAFARISGSSEGGYGFAEPHD